MGESRRAREKVLQRTKEGKKTRSKVGKEKERKEVSGGDID